ncbi:MAG: Asp-tRNA(Asn)/Glu-tRNA(Gln) amidotransferase subunit GatA [SAR324 cluster bacterium]|nr:Asp-tRNA(Asn)/Glu-tRNA(Gln) amidotransferase subunit GatA [SAR324 cluster bacterium]
MLFDTPFVSLVSQIERQTIQATALVNAVYDHIEKFNQELNVYLSYLPRSKALEQAHRIDEKAKSGQPLGKLAGIPFSVKANICVAQKELTNHCASRILENFNSPYNATVIQKLLDEDAILIGITNMDEFAMGSSTENSAFGVTKNPWDLSRVPGGSSGGAAASVATRMAFFALGSDTGGSVRQPASFCGVTGLKPTYGALSRYGLIAYGSSLDQIGCITQRAEDSHTIFSIIHGYDSHDSTSSTYDWTDSPAVDLSALRFCLPEEYMDPEAIEPEVIESVNAMVETLKNNGATVETRSLDFLIHGVPAYYILAFAEASSNLGRFDGIRYGVRGDESSLETVYRSSRGNGFGKEVKRRIMLGTFVLSSGYYDQYYGKANRVRQWIGKEMDKVLGEFDFILGPTAPHPAFKLGEKTENPLTMYLADICTVVSNLAQTPSISIPGKPTASGLPVGIQFMGKRHDDFRMLKTVQALQAVTTHHQRMPDLIS